jgi:hypothetical protein
MVDSFFPCHPGYDPIETFTRIHGRPPPGTARRSRAVQPPPVEAKEEGDESNPPQAGPGEAIAAPATDGGADGAANASKASPAPEGLAAFEPAARGPCSPSELDEDFEEPARLTATPEPAPAPVPRPPIHVRKQDRWNKHKMANFLRELAATHCVAAAARSVGMSRESAYRLRNRLKGQPFDIAWETAFRHGYDALADAALDRAINGVEVPHYANGELVGTHRRYDERLTVALMAMRNREGAPMVGRFGAAAEWWSERWDRMLERVETGSTDWSDERKALGEEELARLALPDARKEADLLIEKHTPEQGHGAPLRR